VNVNYYALLYIMGTKLPSVQAYVATTTKEAVVKLAKKENRTESNMIEILLLEAIIARDKK
jgi:hypothetical protein